MGRDEEWDETAGRNKFEEEWFCRESFTTNISSLAQDAPDSQITEIGAVRLLYSSILSCCWTPLEVEHRAFGLT